MARKSDEEFRKELLYLTEITRFRSVLRQGKIDDEWVHDNDHPSRRIIYLFDANVTFLYFQPTLETHATRILSSIGKSEADEWISIITSQFLFEGNLPGRHGYPIFIDPGHMEEFTENLEATRGDLNAASRALTPERQQELMDRVADVRGQISCARNIEDLKTVFEESFRELFNTFGIKSMASPKLLRDLIYRRDLIRPLSLGPYLQGTDLARLDPERVDAWTSRLAEQAGQKMSRTRNLKRDAECLARLDLINASLRQNGTQVRYVLVTADNKVVEAARREAASQKLDTNVRSIHQYIALGNIRDIQNNVDSMRGTLAIEHAIDALFAVQHLEPESRDARIDQLLNVFQKTLRHIEDPERDYEATRRHKALYDFLFGKQVSEALAETAQTVKREWDDLLVNAVNLNQRLILEHYLEWLADLLDVIDDLPLVKRQELTDSYEAEQIETAGKLTRTHVFVIMEASLSANAGLAQQWVQLGLGVRLSSTDQGDLLSDMAADCVMGLASQDIEGSIRKLREICEFEGPTQSITIAAAAIALQSGLWNVAGEFARVSHGITQVPNHNRFDIVRNRSVLIEALSNRASIMSVCNDDEIAAKRYLVQTKSSWIALQASVGELIEHGWKMEAALSYAEMSWCAVVEQLVAPEPEPLKLAEFCEAVVINTGYCFDFASQSDDLGIVDFKGNNIAMIAKGRASAALVFAGLIYALQKRSVPFAMRSMFGIATVALEQLADSRAEVSADGIWRLLSDISKTLSEIRSFEELVFPPKCLNSLDEILTTNQVTFDREIHLLRAALTEFGVED